MWLKGTHGVGKTTTSALLQELIPNAHMLDAERVGEVLMDVRPGLPETDNFQHWAPWRTLVVKTARRVLDYAGGTVLKPITAVVEHCWPEICERLATHAIPLRHFVLHADRETLERRVANDAVMQPSPRLPRRLCGRSRQLASA